jgi:assimilatory nitrate reductase electron transfer subunit
MSPRKVVIVGYGMAGARLAEELRRRDPAGAVVAVTAVGEERRQPYNRVLLSAVLSGSLTTDAVRLQDIRWAADHGVDLLLGIGAESVDRAARVVTLTDGSTVEYDALVMATGARAWVPPVEGLLTAAGKPAAGVATFRTLDDCERIAGAADPGAPVAVLGGGLLGLEAARGLAERGCQVTVVHPMGHLMERQLDPGAGHVLARTMRELGVHVRLNATASRYVEGDGLKLDDGGHVAADLVVVAAGVCPDTTVARGCGLAVERGVLVDDALRTSDARVHAIGDCAQHPRTAAGLVQPAWEQAGVLADLLTGTDVAARYRGTPPVTRLKARGVDLAAIGATPHTDTDADERTEVVCVTDPARGRYAKLVVRDDRIAGAILLGVPDAAATITQLYDRGASVPTDRVALLLGRALPPAPTDAFAATIVCRCNTVSTEQLTAAWRGGARTLAEVVGVTRATTGCGTCHDRVADTLDRLAMSATADTVEA